MRLQIKATLRLLLLGLAAPMLAAGPDSARLYREAMAEGRSLTEHGKHPAAVQAFERALAANPGDANAASKLGLALFHAGQLERAAEVTASAIAGAKDPKLKAAALYNRGLIEEKRGDKSAAAESFRQSLALRPNAVVSARLASLRMSASSALGGSGPFAPRPLAGPYPSLDAWCATAKQDSAPPEKCFLDESKQAKLAQPSGPWQAAQTLLSGAFDDRQLRVAARTPAGWFVSQPAGDSSFLIVPREAVLVDAVGSPAWLSIRYVQVTATTDRPESARWTQECSEQLVLCGLATGDRPSCTRSIPVREGGCTDPNKQIEWAWELDVQILAGGSLQVKPKRGAIPATAKQFLGKYQLSFR